VGIHLKVGMKESFTFQMKNAFHIITSRKREKPNSLFSPTKDGSMKVKKLKVFRKKKVIHKNKPMIKNEFILNLNNADIAIMGDFLFTENMEPLELKKGIELKLVM
jgi:hypothetical protein